MNNSDIRMKALAKAKDHNFSPASAFTYFIMGVVLLAGDVTGIFAADLAVSAVLAFAVGLICGPGYVHLAMETWRHGEKKFAGLFWGFRNIKKALIPAAAYAAMLLVFRFLVLANEWYFALAAGIGCAALNLLSVWAAYAIEIYDDMTSAKAALQGVTVMIKNLSRVSEMRLYIYWWIAAVMGGILWICNASGLFSILTALVVFLVGLVCRWMVGAFTALCEAGLARNLMK